MLSLSRDKTVEGADGRQDMHGSGPLGAPCFEPTARFASGQEGSEAPFTSIMGQEALPKMW
jgi:hypothetical protein